MIAENDNGNRPRSAFMDHRVRFYRYGTRGNGEFSLVRVSYSPGFGLAATIAAMLPHPQSPAFHSITEKPAPKPKPNHLRLVN
jgi:hypothetical protein